MSRLPRCAEGTALLLVLALGWFAGPAFAYQDLGLRLASEDPAMRLRDLDMGDRLDRVDEIAAALEQPGADVDSLLLELGRLYSSSPLMKHRVWALEAVSKLEDPESLAAIRERAFRYGRTWNPWDSKEMFDRLVETYPDSSSTHRIRGVFLLDTALPTLDEERIDEAVESFRRATACDGAGYDDWLGLASALLAANERRELRRVGERLLELDPDRIPGQLFAAVGCEAWGFDYQAEAYFRGVIGRIHDEDLRAHFLDLEGFLAQFQPLLLRDSMLADLVPQRLLGWWVRLVECEVLFGNPDRRIHGWETSPGEVFLLFGRPIMHVYYPPFQRPTPEELTALHHLGDHHTDIAIALWEIGFDDGMWLWILKVGDLEIPYMFSKGAAYASWTPTYSSEYTFYEPLRNAMPFSLLVRPEEPPPDRYLELDVRHATFWSGNESIRAESSLAVRPVNLTENVPLVATLTILDASNRVVERLQRELIPQAERVTMLDRLPGASGRVEGSLTQFAASLSPGRYIFRIEVESPDAKLFAATDQGFDLRPWRGVFDISDLQLCDSFVDYEPEMDVPGEFVKYARVVVPHPEHRAHRDQELIYVYYEVYGAEADETGQARLDTLYEVFDRTVFNPLNAGRAGSQWGAEHARLQAHFPEERIGRSAQGIVVKGTAVDVSELPTGDYVLAVRVSDVLGHRETYRYVTFAH